MKENRKQGTQAFIYAFYKESKIPCFVPVKYLTEIFKSSKYLAEIFKMSSFRKISERSYLELDFGGCSVELRAVDRPAREIIG